MSHRSSPQPLVKGEVYDRPQYPDAIPLQRLVNYLDARLLFIDAFKDATRHDQGQLFDSMVARYEDFQGSAMAEIANEDREAVRLAASQILSLKLNEGTMLDREIKMLHAAKHLERLLIEYGYFIAKRRPVVVPFDQPEVEA